MQGIIDMIYFAGSDSQYVDAVLLDKSVLNLGSGEF